MKVLAGPSIKTPFGAIKLPDFETPPIELPTKPDEHAVKAIGHGLGVDLAGIIGLIPWIGDLVEDALQTLHETEIRKILTSEEYTHYTEYNKALPSAAALARIFCFKKI